MIEKIMALLKERNISKNTFAKDIGVTASTISDWQSGRLKPNAHIAKIAQYFNVTTDYLLGLTDYPTTPSPELVEYYKVIFETYRINKLLDLETFKKLSDCDKLFVSKNFNELVNRLEKK